MGGAAFVTEPGMAGAVGAVLFGPNVSTPAGTRRLTAAIQEAAKQGARLIELRLDFLKKAPDFKRLLANKPWFDAMRGMRQRRARERRAW